MIIVLHCSYINKVMDINLELIIQNLIRIFSKHKDVINLLLQANLIDIMNWRASQSINNLIPMDLQWSSQSNIVFCGDWFDLGKIGRVETALIGSIRLSRLLTLKPSSLILYIKAF